VFPVDFRPDHNSLLIISNKHNETEKPLRQKEQKTQGTHCGCQNFWPVFGFFAVANSQERIVILFRQPLFIQFEDVVLSRFWIPRRTVP
jgi:hypothetical protein